MVKSQTIFSLSDDFISFRYADYLIFSCFLSLFRAIDVTFLISYLIITICSCLMMSQTLQSPKNSLVWVILRFLIFILKLHLKLSRLHQYFFFRSFIFISRPTSFVILSVWPSCTLTETLVSFIHQKLISFLFMGIFSNLQLSILHVTKLQLFLFLNFKVIWNPFSW